MKSYYYILIVCILAIHYKNANCEVLVDTVKPVLPPVPKDEFHEVDQLDLHEVFPHNEVKEFNEEKYKNEKVSKNKEDAGFYFEEKAGEASEIAKEAGIPTIISPRTFGWFGGWGGYYGRWRPYGWGHRWRHWWSW